MNRLLVHSLDGIGNQYCLPTDLIFILCLATMIYEVWAPWSGNWKALSRSNNESSFLSGKKRWHKTNGNHWINEWAMNETGFLSQGHLGQGFSWKNICHSSGVRNNEWSKKFYNRPNQYRFHQKQDQGIEKYIRVDFYPNTEIKKVTCSSVSMLHAISKASNIALLAPVASH